MPTNPAANLAICILRWIYSQIVQILEMLKAILLGIIAFIDIQIAWLRAQLAMLDILSQIEQLAWAVFQGIVDEIRNRLTNFPEGPLKELCPEFYQLFFDPALQIFDTAVAAITVYRERYKNVVSFMDEVDALLQYWETIKTDLTNTIDLIDDAIFLKLMEDAAEMGA